MNQRPPLLMIVSSPSGAGKTTLCRRLLAEFDDLVFSISHTTRTPRQGEVHGKDYFFVSQEQFDQMVAEGRFVEWAHVHGNRYGTAVSEVEAAARAGKDILFDVDFQGAEKIKRQYADAIGVFVLPPSIGELSNRLRSRGTETESSLARRFQAAQEEIAHHGLFDYLLVNDDLDAAYDRLRAILLAERSRHFRSAPLAEAMLAERKGAK